MSHMEWTSEESGIRLDKFLSTVSDLSRTRVQELTKAGEVFVNGTAEKSSYKVQVGDVVSCDIPEDAPTDII
ncbi:MAG TPA: RNA pseudouridine synthase, partial [Erysipelotrichaceae bacterium]|nr:RNA pseudouridine synthase [Erysipelotrichaceae bacterium]